MARKKSPPSQKASTKNVPNPLWGGHFQAGPSAIMATINSSIKIDQRLYAEDIRASIAHAMMLERTKIISTKDYKDIAGGLKEIMAAIDNGSFVFSEELEDIHMNIEARLKEKIGDAAGRLHTARSRNDQVATDFRLFLREAIDTIDEQLKNLQRALLDQADQNADTLMPGFTHLQSAQPITFGHHLMAYTEMLGRDRGRFKSCQERLNELPLGAAALAGTSFPIDRHFVARHLGFREPMANSMDAVSARDFALEFLAACSILGTHLSRLGEEIVLWASPLYAFITLSEAFTTGSSIMPQKRNPDAAELVRGKMGRLLGSFTALAVVIKGLPLAYAKDLQEDKELVFDALDTLLLCVAAMTGMIDDMKANKDAMERALEKGFITATDVADYLVRVAAIPFRDAHHITGQLVRLAEKKNCRLDQLSLKDIQAIDARIGKDIHSVLAPLHAVNSRLSYGGTAPKRVREAIKTARKKYLR